MFLLIILCKRDKLVIQQNIKSIYSLIPNQLYPNIEKMNPKKVFLITLKTKTSKKLANQNLKTEASSIRRLYYDVDEN